MRTVAMLSTAIALATTVACSDDHASTAPIKARGSVASAGEATVASTNAAPVKGTIAFTKVTTVTTAEFPVDAGTAVAHTADCPAGTTLIGGGYAFSMEGNPDAPPRVSQSQPFYNSWWVRVTNWATNAHYASVIIYATCVS